MILKHITYNELADAILSQQMNATLIVDSRSMLEYNDHHIQNAVNVCGSKLMKKRLQCNQISVLDLLDSVNCKWSISDRVVVYDQQTINLTSVADSHFFYVLVDKLLLHFNDVSILSGGFSEFSYKYPKLCDSKRKSGCALLSISTPCATSNRNCPPTKVLPFLYLGSEEDAQSEDILRTCRVKYVLNASQTAADTPHCNKAHYLRIPIRDSSNENIVAWFQTAFDFIDKVKESDDHILLHCVGGVSRSATIAIGYVMRHFSLSLDNAYSYVKKKRPTISPNLNFMGQLLEYEKQLLKETKLICTPFSELNLESVYNNTLSDNYISQEKEFIANQELDNISPSTESSDDVFPSPLSDTFPSPSSDGFSSASDDVSYSSTFTDLQKPLIKPEFKLHLDFGNNKSSSLQNRKKFTLELPLEKRT